MVQPLWKLVWQFLKKINIHFTYNPAVHAWIFILEGERLLLILSPVHDVRGGFVCNGQKPGKSTLVLRCGSVVKENVD